MSLIPEIADGQLCDHCRLHAATLIASESAMHYVHGFLNGWCECCYLGDQIRQVEKAMNTYPKLLEDLRSACTDQPARDPQRLVTEKRQLRDEAQRQWTLAHSLLCGKHYPGQDAMNYAHPHADGEHCYWPKPEVLQ